jgi:hypothetical protein
VHFPKKKYLQIREKTVQFLDKTDKLCRIRKLDIKANLSLRYLGQSPDSGSSTRFNSRKRRQWSLLIMRSGLGFPKISLANVGRNLHRSVLGMVSFWELLQKGLGITLVTWQAIVIK